MNNEIVFLPVRDLSKIIQKKEMSPVDVTKLFLSRLEEIGPEYNSVVTITQDLALYQAKKAEKEILCGNYKSPLHGIPYGAKDLLSTSGGIPTTWGAVPFRDRTFDYDATVIIKLHEAGAILAAKLAMVEFAGGMGYKQPNASLTGPCRSPWGKENWAGGSSSGSGSAVGCGLIPFAIGSETWGSILTPANNCGVSGLRPTYGRVSKHGAMALSWTLDKLGPLGLTADDCGLVLDAISGSDANDPSSSRMDYSYSLGRLQQRPMLGMLKDTLSETPKDISDNFQASLAILNDFADTEEFTFPEYPYEETIRTIMLGESASAFEEITEKGLAGELTAPEDRYGPYARTIVLAKDYIKALRIRGMITPQIDTIMSKYDAIIGPTRRTPVSSLYEEFRGVGRGNTKDLLGAIGNLLGLPAISVPNGFTKDNLPTGIQFLGRPYEENRIMTIANKYQSLPDWHTIHPESLLEKKDLSGEGGTV